MDISGLRKIISRLDLNGRKWYKVWDYDVYRVSYSGYIVLLHREYPFEFTSTYGANHDLSYSGCLYGTANEALTLDEAKDKIIKQHKEFVNWYKN